MLASLLIHSSHFGVVGGPKSLSGRFDRYAGLGDDVIICDDLVAAQYLEVLDEIQVKISLIKSLISLRVW
jgi:hypothetical protein